MNYLNIDHISKEEFLEAYNKNKPNNWIIYAFRYFSKNTAQEDKWLSRIIQILLIIFYIIGFIGAIFMLNRIYLILALIPFAFILINTGILMTGALIMNNLRIRKIRKILGITKQEYNYLVILYL